MMMLKSQLSLKRKYSGSILGRIGALSVLKQLELTKNKKLKIGGNMKKKLSLLELSKNVLKDVRGGCDCGCNIINCSNCGSCSCGAPARVGAKAMKSTMLLGDICTVGARNNAQCST
jgi:hypothetical protein